MNTKELINKYLPGFIFNDASNRNDEEIVKLTLLCRKNDKFLIYQKRNIHNEYAFKEMGRTIGDTDINELFINNGKYYIFCKDNEISINNLSPVFYLKRQITNDMECVICYSYCDKTDTNGHCEAICCYECSVVYCHNCLSKLIYKLDTYKCAVCRKVINLQKGSSELIN